MQKLEEILRAEETARHTVASAKERANALVLEAEAASKTLISDTRADVAERSAQLREQALADADTEASRLTSAAQAELDETIAIARSRVRAAAEAAVAALSE